MDPCHPLEVVAVREKGPQQVVLYGVGVGEVRLGDLIWRRGGRGEDLV